jgi:hypothetical protein
MCIYRSRSEMLLQGNWDDENSTEDRKGPCSVTKLWAFPGSPPKAFKHRDGDR